MKQNESKPKMWEHRDDILACAALSIFWLITLLVIGLDGEFSLSDDWVYAKTTWNFLETGRFERVGWTWAPIITNVAIGASFSTLFGSTFEVLRASSAFMGWIGILGAYFLCRQLGSGPLWSAAGAALYGWNPLHVALSLTFMTDIPFAAFCTWSLVFFVGGLRTHDKRWIGGGIIAAISAILSRQLGLAIPIATAAAAMLGLRLRLRTVMLIGAGVGVAVAIFTFGPALIYGSGDAARMFTIDIFIRRILRGPHALYFLAKNSLVAFVYLGAFLAPIALLQRSSGSRRTQELVVGVCASVIVVAAIVWRDLPVPPGGDWIYDFGLGPLKLVGSAGRSALGSTGWFVVVALASFAGGIALVRLCRLPFETFGNPPERAVSSLLLGFPLVYLGVLSVYNPSFDRYLIPLLPPLIALLLPHGRRATGGRPAAIAAAVAAIALLVYGVSGTRDYLEHNRVRTALLEDLLAQGIPSIAIDGGTEFYMRYNIAPDWHGFIDHAFQRQVVDEEYIVGFETPLQNYHPVTRQSYRRWLPPIVEELVVYHRDDAAQHLHR